MRRPTGAEAGAGSRHAIRPAPGDRRARARRTPPFPLPQPPGVHFCTALESDLRAPATDPSPPVEDALERAPGCIACARGGPIHSALVRTAHGFVGAMDQPSAPSRRQVVPLAQSVGSYSGEQRSPGNPTQHRPEQCFEAILSETRSTPCGFCDVARPRSDPTSGATQSTGCLSTCPARYGPIAQVWRPDRRTCGSSGQRPPVRPSQGQAARPVRPLSLREPCRGVQSS